MSKMLSIRIPDDLYDAIAKQAKAKNVSQTQLCIEVLAEALHFGEYRGVGDRLTDVERRLSVLEKKV